MIINIDTPEGAKEYLIARILVEAKRNDVPMTEVEAKMLHYSATDSTLPDMDVVHGAFERYHDMREYEAKIQSLIRAIRQRDRDGDEKAVKAWNHAVRKLSVEHHYVLSMIQAADKTNRPAVELVKWLIAALVIVGVSMAVAFYFHYHNL